MSEYVARELEDPTLEINDSCGAIVRQWEESVYDNEQLDPHITCDNSESDPGTTWRDRGKTLGFMVKPGFSVEISFRLKHYNSGLIPPEWENDVEESYACSSSCHNIYFPFSQGSRYHVGFICVDGSPEETGNDSESYDIITSPITVSVTPCFSGSGILRGSDNMPLADGSGRILTAG